MKRMKLLSDIHLELLIDGKGLNEKGFSELGALFSNDEDVDILIIAGDLCTSRLLHWFVEPLRPYFEQYQSVIYVAGNHEYWGSTLSKTHNLIYEFTEHFDNVFYLENDYYDAGDFYIFGMTYWYHGLSPLDEYDMKRFLKDFQRIRQDNYSKTFPHMFEAISLQSQKEFYKFVEESDKKVVLVTHHPTSTKFYGPDEKFEAGYGSPLKLPMTIDLDKIPLCLHGHTHKRMQYINEYGIPTMINAVGYHGYERINKIPMTMEI